MRVAFSVLASILSTLAPLLIKEAVFLSQYRQASERQKLVHKCVCPILECPQLDSVIVRLRPACSRSCLSDSLACGTSLSPGSRVVESCLGELDCFFEVIFGWAVGGRCRALVVTRSRFWMNWASLPLCMTSRVLSTIIVVLSTWSSPSKPRVMRVSVLLWGLLVKKLCQS